MIGRDKRPSGDIPVVGLSHGAWGQQGRAVYLTEFRVLDVRKIQPNRLNPRLEFGKKGLDELSDSIKEKASSSQ